MEAKDGKDDYQEVHWMVIGVAVVASVREIFLKRVLNKLEPMVRSHCLEDSIAATVGTGIVAT